MKFKNTHFSQLNVSKYKTDYHISVLKSFVSGFAIILETLILFLPLKLTLLMMNSSPAANLAKFLRKRSTMYGDVMLTMLNSGQYFWIATDSFSIKKKIKN